MLRNNIERDLKTRLYAAGLNQVQLAEKVGVSSPYVNRIVNGKEQLINKTFLSMLEELGYDVKISYVKKGGDQNN